MKRSILSLVLIAIITIIALAAPINPVSANIDQQDKNWCGNGSEADNYGFTYDYSQPHWTVGNNLVSEQTMVDIDVILDELNADQLAQTMILVLPEDQVGIPVNCAVHFLRYMELGLVDGPHADNGFSFLFIVGDGKIDVHYGVGLGLPALTAQNLTPLNRLAEEKYKETQSLDTAILETIKAYDIYVRSEYAVSPTPTAVPPVVAAPQTSPKKSPASIAFLCLGILGIFLFIGLVIYIIAKKKSDNEYTPTYYSPSNDGGSTIYSSYAPSSPSTYTRPSSSSDDDDSSSRPSPSSGNSYRPSTPSRPTFTAPSRPPSSPPTRGGSGSGRSGRGG